MRFLPLMTVVSLLLAGCAGNDYIVQRQGSMEGRINQMMQSQNETAAQVAELSQQVKALKEQIARHLAEGKTLASDHAQLQEKVQILSRRLERKEVEDAARPAARIELVNNDGADEGREEKVQSEYMRAFGLFSSNNYAAAIDAFSIFINTYPASEYAANARYWLAECYFAQGSYKLAIEAYARVLESNNNDKRGADAMLKTGLSWYGLNERDKGEAVLKGLLEKYPGSDASAKAAEQLERK